MGEAQAEGVRVPEAQCVVVRVPAGDALPEGDSLTLAVAEGHDETVGDTLAEGDVRADAEGDAHHVPLPREGVALTELQGERVGDRDKESDTLGEPEAARVPERRGEPLALGERDDDAEREALWEAEGDAPPRGDAVSAPDAVTLGLPLTLWQEEGERVAEAKKETEALPVVDSDAEGEGEGVMVPLAQGGGDAVAAAV